MCYNLELRMESNVLVKNKGWSNDLGDTCDAMLYQVLEQDVHWTTLKLKDFPRGIIMQEMDEALKDRREKQK
jgi:hypothetical protein